jgi:hypothetical protein
VGDVEERGRPLLADVAVGRSRLHAHLEWRNLERDPLEGECVAWFVWDGVTPDGLLRVAPRLAQRQQFV